MNESLWRLGATALAVGILGCSGAESSPTATDANAIYVGNYVGAGLVLVGSTSFPAPSDPAPTVTVTLSQLTSTLSGTIDVRASGVSLLGGALTGHTTATGATIVYVDASCGARATGTLRASGAASIDELAFNGTACDPLSHARTNVLVDLFNLVRQ